MKLDQKDEEIVLDSVIDGFDIEEMTEKLPKWIISNHDDQRRPELKCPFFQNQKSFS